MPHPPPLPLLVLLALAVRVAAAQPEAVQPEAVQPAGEGAPPVFVQGGRAVVAADTLHGRVLYLADGQLWSYDLRADAWRFLQPLALPHDVGEGAYDAVRDELVLWSRGVGDVYTWRDGEAEVTRIDRSFPHRTQFGHAGMYDAASGSIYAFGGYGFWYYRNYVTRFDRTSREWFLQPLAPGSPQPAERTDALGVYWPQRRALFILGGEGVPGGRVEPLAGAGQPTHDLWRFDLDANTWTRLARSLTVGPTAINSNGIGTSNSAAWTALDAGAGRWFFAPMAAPDQPQRQLHALDLERGDAEPVARLWEDPVELLGMVWDAPRRRVVLLAFPLGGDVPAKPVQVWQVPVPEPTPRAAGWEGPGAAWPALLLLGVLAASVGAFVLLLHRARHGSGRGRRASLEAAGNGALVVVPGARPAVQIHGEEVPLPEVERQLLFVLAEARASGTPFIPADVIDEALFAGYDNLDYVRKMRNEALRGLSDALEPYRAGRGDLITRRRATEDRRRIEYALGEAVQVIVEEPGEGAFAGATARGAAGSA